MTNNDRGENVAASFHVTVARNLSVFSSLCPQRWVVLKAVVPNPTNNGGGSTYTCDGFVAMERSLATYSSYLNSMLEDCIEGIEEEETGAVVVPSVIDVRSPASALCRVVRYLKHHGGSGGGRAPLPCYRVPLAKDGFILRGGDVSPPPARHPASNNNNNNSGGGGGGGVIEDDFDYALVMEELVSGNDRRLLNGEVADLDWLSADDDDDGGSGAAAGSRPGSCRYVSGHNNALELMEAANFLQIRPLTQLACLPIASMMTRVIRICSTQYGTVQGWKHASSKLRILLDIQNDWTDGQFRELEDENAWCEPIRRIHERT